LNVVVLGFELDNMQPKAELLSV